MGCDGLMKAFLVTLNIIFFLIGTATLSVGIWVEVDNQHLFDLTKDVSGSDLSDTDIPSLLENAVIVLIGAGAFIFLLGFLGCCGALQPKTRGGKLFLKIYCTIVLILVVVELAAVVVAYLFFDKVDSKLEDILRDSLNRRYNASFRADNTIEGKYTYSSNGDPITLAWDIVQLQYECCGLSNGLDYGSPNITWNSADLHVPPTCCEIRDGSNTLIADLKNSKESTFTLENENCPSKAHDEFKTGCYEEVKQAIEDNSFIFIGIGSGTVGVEVFCILFACCLARKNPDEVDDIKIPADEDT